MRPLRLKGSGFSPVVEKYKRVYWALILSSGVALGGSGFWVMHFLGEFEHRLAHALA